MKYLLSTCIIYLSFFCLNNFNCNAQKTLTDVISSGGAESSSGNYSNFGVLGESIVNNSVTAGNYNSTIGFIYSDIPDCIPVSIVSHPNNQTFTIGSAVTFKIAVAGAEPFNYEWYKNGVQIPNANSSSYTTPLLSSGDNGSYYYCIITNCGSTNQVKSNSAYITLESIQNTLSISSNPVNGGTTTGSGTYEYNQLVTVKASPNSGYEFVNWTIDGKQVSQNSTYTFNIVDDINLVVNFSKLNQPKIYINPASMFIYEQSNKSVKVSKRNFYKITEHDLSVAKKHTGLAQRVIVPQSVTKSWQADMIEKYGVSYSLPKNVDWSIYDNPARDQKRCGSCWAFAAVAQLENLANQNQILAISDLSEQQLVSCVPNNSCSGGWYFSAFNYVKKNGLTLEDCFPYTYSDSDCSNQCIDPGTMVNISQFTNPLWGSKATVNDLKLALQEGPLCVAMYVPDDFHSYKGGIYNYKSGDYSWGHAVLLVGYNDNLQCFKVRNSWGSWWGENGYFRIAYDDVTDVPKFGSYASYAKGIYIEHSNVTVADSFMVQNLGKSNLIINNIASDKQWLSVSPSNSTLIPSGTTFIKISIVDWHLISGSSESAIITINSNDPIDPVKYVSVTAQKSVNSSKPELLVTTDFYQDKLLPISNGSFDINVEILGQGNVSWHVEVSDPWLSQPLSNRLNEGIIVVNYSMNNTGKSRTGYITINSNEVSNSPQVVSVTQSNNNAPEITDINLEISSPDNNVYFNSSDFISHFTDLDNNTLKFIRIITFPTNGTLKLNNDPVVAFQSITENDIKNLYFVPDDDWDGILDFEYNASDGVNYAKNSAYVTSHITDTDFLEMLKAFNIYPNPTNQRLNICFNAVPHKYYIEFYNSAGQCLLQKESSKKVEQINIGEFAHGIYYLKIHNNEFSKIEKIIVNSAGKAE